MSRGGSGTSQMGSNGGTIPAWGGGQYAAELRILLVYLSESLGRLGQNWGPLGATFFIVGAQVSCVGFWCKSMQVL